MTTKIKDLKAGDEFTGKIGENEYVLEEDGTITCSAVVLSSENKTFNALAEDKIRLTNDIAYRQLLLAEVNKRIAMQTAAPAPVVVEK